MKNIVLGIATLFAAALFVQPLNAQSSSKKNSSKKIQTETFLVEGVCMMCEKRIEKAALQAGVVSADWDKDSKGLTIIYKPKKASLQQVKEALSEAGHDTEDVKASEEAYAKLPDCCAYRDGVKTH